MHRTPSTAQGSSHESAPPLGPEIQTAIRTEMESMLNAPIFTQSGRCKRFLTYVVLQTLSGNASELKERTIGISVFQRANDYETGDDSIVRVTANEVRKRLGQFYAESQDAHTIQIELPRGSYVPEFRIQPSKKVQKADRGAHSESGNGALESSEAPSTTQTASASPVIAAADIARPLVTDLRRWTWAMPVAFVIVGVAIFVIWRNSTFQRVPDLWGSFQNANAPILICVDTHDLHLRSATPTENDTFVNLVLYKQIISLDDAAVLSTMASVLGKKGIPFRVVGAEQTSLADFRRQPVILIGAIDNKWTLLLTQGLRYRIEVANPPGSGSGKEPIASIVDSENPTNTLWTTDLSIPFAAWKNDYAIVARIDDPTTGVPVLIEAGLGNTGSLAASELITSGALEARLEKERPCYGKRNFEAVVGTEIIDTKSGPPHVMRFVCW
jgi:hypothetical protein